VDLGVGIASGVFAFNEYQKRNHPEERRLIPLLKRGYNANKQTDRLAAEAELEKEASVELAKLMESERTSTTGARS
jgi:hypothetical protein